MASESREATYRNKLRLLMAVDVKSDAKVSEDLQDRVVQDLWRKTSACAPDIATELGEDVSVKQVLRALEQLEDEGVVRRVEPDSEDPREYESPYQDVFELAG